MHDIPSRPHWLEEEAVYLGVLTARRVKPLSRLEYPVGPQVLGIFDTLGLMTAPVTRFAQNGAQVTHTILSRDRSLIRHYLVEFDTTIIQGEVPAVVRAEARHFGYPACCAEAYINQPYAPNGLAGEDQTLLFHHACPGCKKTPGLIPLYRSALAETRHILSSYTRQPSFAAAYIAVGVSGLLHSPLTP